MNLPRLNNNKVVYATTISPAVVTVTFLTKLVTNNFVYIDNQLVYNELALIIAKEKKCSLRIKPFSCAY